MNVTSLMVKKNLYPPPPPRKLTDSWLENPPGLTVLYVLSKMWWIFQCHSLVLREGTLPETNIFPEDRPLEKEIPIGNHHFLGANC